jgi:hypothetical protein
MGERAIVYCSFKRSRVNFSAFYWHSAFGIIRQFFFIGPLCRIYTGLKLHKRQFEKDVMLLLSSLTHDGWG